MNQHKSSSELKNIAREKLRGKYGSAMLVTPVIPIALSFSIVLPLMMMLIVPYSVYLVMSNSLQNTYGIYIVTYAIMIPLSVLFGVLNTGSSLFFLNIACGRQTSVSDLFYGFRHHFKKSLGVSAATILLSYICLLPYLVFSALSSAEPDFSLWSILMLISYIVGIAIYTPIQLSLSMSYYLLLDFPQYSTKEILKLSMQVMKGHKGKLFYMQCSFIPVQLLCIFSFYIGYLWAIPYMNMTTALFFLDIMKPQQATEEYNPFTN